MGSCTSFPNKDTVLVFDADLILYQKGFKHEDTEEFWVIEEDINSWIYGFFEKFGTSKYILYLTGKGNFREELAVSHKYKDRTARKPRWYKEIREFLIYMHRTEVIDGMEADDAIGIHLTKESNSIHIGIDKDILQVQGWHYRYGTHNSPEVPLRYISNEGFLELEEGTKKKKLKGGGYPWFYAQMLLGDRTDSIFGPQGYGDVKVWNTLKDCSTEREYYEAVLEVYKESFENPEERLQENANLLYMIRELTEEGEPVLWKPEETDEELDS